MIPFYPINRYRPQKVRDGVGGSTEALGTAVVIRGVVQVNKTETLMIVDSGEDVVINDVVAVKED